MKKLVVILLCFGLVGCATVTRFDTQTASSLYNAMTKKQISQKRAYDYSYDDVYRAIKNVLELRLRYGVSRLHTRDNIIYSSYLEAHHPGAFIGFAYSYLFELNEIDDSHTQVSLRASGGTGSVSDVDIMNKYIREELAYQEKSKKD